MSEWPEKFQTPESTPTEALEEAPEKTQTIAAFLEFVQKHQDEIKEASKESIAKLADFFYYDFYSVDSDAITNAKEHSLNENILKQYESSIKEMRARLSEAARHDSRTMDVENEKDWLWCSVNFKSRIGATGRFYLNIKPEHIANFFEQAAIAFRDAGLNIDIKIPNAMDLYALNRFDKVVIYFDSAEEKGSLRVLDDLYRNNHNIFDTDGIPRFTVTTKDANGADMVGVGFGENPDPAFENNSFGMIRARILAEVYNDARRSDLSVDSPRFDFETAFKKSCERWLVDPQHPAFNLSGNPENFALLKKRLGMRPEA